MRHHEIWVPSLHPRGAHGRFTRSGHGGSGHKLTDKERAARDKAKAKRARKLGNQPVSEKARKERRKGYRQAGFRAAGGVVSGASLVALGQYTGNRRYIAAGVARAGVGVAEANMNIKATRRVTSKDFRKLSKEQQTLERAALEKKSRRVSLAVDLGDAALGAAAQRSLKRHIINRELDTASDAVWHREKAENPGGGPFTKYQGPGPHRAKKASTKRSSAGVYDITGRRQVGKPGRAFMRNTTVGTGRSRSQNFASAARKARNAATASARSSAWKARGGSTAVVLRAPGGNTAVVRRARR